jgi:hypothetical protein
MIAEAKTEFRQFTPDERRELYRTNPELFDKLAAEAIKKACIGGTPEETLKLRQMQWTIDVLLQKGKNPFERMKIMEGIFYSHVFGSHGNLSHLVDALHDLAHTAVETEELPASKPALFLIKR